MEKEMLRAKIAIRALAYSPGVANGFLLLERDTECEVELNGDTIAGPKGEELLEVTLVREGYATTLVYLRPSLVKVYRKEFPERDRWQYCG